MEARLLVLSTYQSYLFYTSNPGQTLQRTVADPTVARARTYYAAQIGKVKSVDDLLNNSQLFNYAMNAYGLQDFSYGKAFMRKVLTSDLSDPKSFVNKLTDGRYKAFAQAFNFDTKGKLASTAAAQTSTQSADLLDAYSQAATAATTSEAAYMKTAIGKAKTVDDLTGDRRLLTDLLASYGASPFLSSDTVASILESDKSDPDSAYNTTTFAGLKALADDFNTDTTGAITSAQTDTQAAHTVKGFTAARSAVATTEAAYVKSALSSLTSVSGLINDTRLYGDVLTAYGLDPSMNPQNLTTLLESDLSDPQSAVNLSGSDSLKHLVRDFNFDATGAATTQRVVQTQASTSAMTTAYAAASGTDSYSKAQAAAETTYVATAIGNATSIDDIIKDPRVVSYIGKAFGQPKLDATTLRAILTSDLGNPKSKANTLGANAGQLAAAFEFTPSGTIAREASQTAQSRSSLATTNSAYIQQTIETQAGQDNPGTQLALYFARKAPTITTVYQILADPALLKFAQTSFGLPTSTSSQNIDSQAHLLQNKLKLPDLKDPAKVKLMVARFSALYDLANPTASQSGIMTLFSSSTDK